MLRQPQPFLHRLLYSYLSFLIIWLFTGFSLGTVVLLFPIRTWIDFVRQKNLSSAGENTGVVLMIFLLIAISFLFTKKIFHWHRHRQKWFVTAVAFVVPMLCAGAALKLFMNPELVNKGSSAAEISAQFTIGSYPTKEKIKDLQNQGFTGIISLLHPAVVPFEPALLADEEAAAKHYGIALIKAPMLPWVSDNTASLKTIEQIAKSGKGKYYVHCYLGKDRVNVVKNLIQKITGDASSIHQINTSTYRTFEMHKVMERGIIYRLSDKVYLIPYPTNEELLAFFQTGYVKTVVNIMSGTDAESNMRIQEEQKQLSVSGTTFRNFSVTEKTSPHEQSVIIDSILSYPAPVAVHHWNTTCPESVMFRKMFQQKTGKPAINLATNAAESF